MMASRELEFRITLAKGPAGDQPGETVTLKGHRATVDIENHGGPSQGYAQIAIYGLPLDLLKRLTVTGNIASQVRGRNKIEVLAGDEKNGLSTIFTGTIWISWANFHNAPDVSLSIDAYSNMDLATERATATSFEGTTSYHDVMAALAKKAKLKLEDSGVTGSFSNPAFKGSIQDQVRRCAAAANINATIELGTLAIWPLHGTRDIFAPSISPGHGLIGYPSFSSSFVTVDCEFLPTVHIGSPVKISGSQLGAVVDGTWASILVHHNLASQMPGGPWFTHIELAYRE